jgi:hypothetical protein
VTEAQWENDYALQYAERWLRDEKGICWVEHTAFGKELAIMSGAHYYGAGDDGILDAEGPIIASIRAHSTGKNLQRWSTNLVMAPMPSGDAWEQLLGRTHRAGQLADEVHVDVFVPIPELRECMEKALADCRYIEATLGTKPRLLYADKIESDISSDR